ncbi:hypothetical protein OCK02_02120 [Rhizobium sp. TRM96647]|uniref:hypothetical protein n=1 Tax=unclassified Rhizobium TaxID=2613769 RepID=UPI0021E87C26|nr:MULTISPECIES: hypothetical protein [unclassified Rhizobium]MCV3734985.1 hypothetical protein [Rhizobium sp. TRM96647]MCV3757355.1 hypothetical protein [Rhizobium sp. TRM96650]
MFDDLIPKKSGQHLSYEEGLALLEEEDRSKRMQGGSGAVGAALSSTTSGVPVLGPYLVGAAQRGAAGVSSLINGKSYDENLSAAQDLTSTAQEEHPYITTAGNITGAVGGTIPMIMAAPAAFGAGPGSLFMRSLASAGTGAGIGAADSGARSDWNPKAIQDGMMWGGGLGLIGPTVGKAVGAGAQSAMDWFGNRGVAKAAGTTPATLRRLADAASRDGLDDATLRARLDELGPDAMLADLGPNLRGYAGAVANIPGRGQQIVRSALDTRHDGANARIQSAVDDAMGPNVMPSQLDDTLRTSQDELSPRYLQVFDDARAVDTRPLAENLESQVVNLRGGAQKAARDVRSMLNVHGSDVLDPNPGTLFQTRQAIDGMLATEADPKVIRTLTEARRQIDEILSRSVPGLKEVDGQFAELARQREALARGQTVLDSGRTSPRPTELAQEVADGALPEGMFIGPSGAPVRLRQGARAEIDRILGSNANDVAALHRLIKTEGDWNRARLTTLFGQEKADRLFRVLDAERTFAATREFATGNSATAGRQQAIKEIGADGDDSLSRLSYAAGGMKGAARAAGVKVADRIAERLFGPYRESSRASLAEAVTGGRERLVDALSQAQRRGGNPALVEAITKAILLGGGTAGAR